VGSGTTANRNPRGVVAVGASAGGVDALTQFVAGLPDDLPFAVTVVMHLQPNRFSMLDRILDRAGPLPALRAEHGAQLESGHIYVGVPGRHLLVHDQHLVLSQGPTENNHRPAINALFRSVALAYGPRAIGLLLSGARDDGALGSAAIRARGGTTIAQTPRDATFAAMPTSAIEAGAIDHQIAVADAGRLLMTLADREIEDTTMERDTQLELENRIAMGSRFSVVVDTEDLGPPTGYVCPDCNGSLQEITAGNFRCHVGHAWTIDALLGTHDSEVENALWMALRSLQEKSRAARRMAKQTSTSTGEERYGAVAEEAERALKILGEHLAQAFCEIAEPGAGR
jgi:two-component system, chemotaxis family, protein-glutamate methylesterase/glutaminase